MPRHFTPDEANRLLQRIGPMMENLVARRNALREHQELLAAFRTKAGGNGGVARGRDVVAARQAVDRITAEIRQGLQEIQALGCVVKDLDMGLLDFPALRDGQEVYLCWRVGEDRIESWHGIDEGYTGRKPLDDLF